MKNFYKITSNVISIIHIPIIFFIFFGWLFTGVLSYIYLGILVGTLLSWQLLGYCILAKWEFDIRSKYMRVPKYHYEYLHYWSYKLFNLNINAKYIRNYGTLFIICSMILWTYKNFI